MPRAQFLSAVVVLVVLLPASVCAQLPQSASLVGQLHVARGDFPAHRVLIELRYRGSAIETAYTDTDGRFGFSNIVGGEYHVSINDELYDQVDERVIVNPDVSPYSMVQITLSPRGSAPAVDSLRTRVVGSNGHIVDPSEYDKRFPKKAIQEYGKGVKADQQSKREDAISHYQAALKIAPDYYPAHNNLGSDYLSKSNLAAARKEFEQAVRLNLSDATGYFNLSNVCRMMGQLAEAQQYLDEGLRREPDSALGYFLVGSLDMKAGKLQQAEAALRHTIQLSPPMAQARLQLVNLLLEQGRKGDAASELRQFVTMFPDNPFTPKARGLLQKLEGSK